MKNRVVKMLQLDCRVDRGLLPAGRPAERYALMILRMPEVDSSTARLPVNLSLILDRSGSMQGDKLRFLQRAVAHTLRHLTPSDVVSIVAYDDEVEIVAPPFKVTPENTNAALANVEKVWAGGKTNLSLGWFTGCDQIADHVGSGVINRAMVLTDGLANEGITDVDLLVNQARELRVRGITTTTFGVGHDFNQFLLQRVADAGGGHFYFIDDPEVIPAFFHGELGEMLSTVAKDIVLEVGVPKGASVEPLNGVPSELAENRHVRILLGDAFSGQTREIVVRVELPAFQRNQHLLLPVSLHYEDTLEGRRVTIEQPGVIFETADEARCRAQRADEDVLRAACRSEVDRAKMEALFRDYEGDLSGADDTLLAAETTIFGLLPPDTARPLVEELGTMSDALHLGLSDASRKKQHYRLYRTQRRRPDPGTPIP